MKIRKLHIKNYKVFDDIELDFTDAHGNTLDKIVLAGVNGCGKTTVLELILSIFNDSIVKKIIKEKDTFIRIEIELTSEEKELIEKHLDIYLKESKDDIDSEEDSKIFSNIKIIIINQLNQLGSDKVNFRLNLDYDKSKVLYQNIISTAIFQNLHLNFKNTSLIYLPFKEIFDVENQFAKVFHLNSDRNIMKNLALKDIRDEIFKNEDITIRESKEKAIKRLKKPLNGLTLTTNLVDLESEELIFESANGQRIKFEDLSSGEQTLYFRAIYLSTLNPQNSIIMIDEPEDSLHPTWQQKVMQLYQNIGENNQVIVATHSPHIIGSSKAEEVFLLQIDAHQIEARHPKYTKGHSIDYVLDEIMGANSRDTSVINLVESYLNLMRKGLHESAEGMKIKANIDALNLDPNSEEIRGLNLSIKRIKAVGV